VLGSNAESRLVTLTAFAMGMALVTFPAASGIVMGSRDYGLSGMQYGELVLPEIAIAILASLTGFGLARRHPTRLAFRIGVTLSLLSMGLLISTVSVEGQQSAFPVLLAASALLGAGFGLTVPVLMAYARFLHATNEDPSLLALNATLALGAIVAPAIAVGFAHLGWWWGLPALVAVLHIVQLLRSGDLPSYIGAPPGPAHQSAKRTLRFSFYALSALLYATCAAIIVIWCQLKMASTPTGAIPAQLTAAIHVTSDPRTLHTSLVLAALWGGLLAAGRVVYAASDRWLGAVWRITCYAVPIVIFSALIAAGLLSGHDEMAVIAVFGIAVVGCSALMPLHMSFNHWDVIAITAALAGGMAAYQLAYGFVADGLRPNTGPGAGLVGIFAAAAVLGIVMATMSLVTISHRPPAPAEAKAPAGPPR